MSPRITRIMFLLLLTPAPLLASVNGVILDPQGVPVARAAVHLLGGVISRTAISDALGNYSIASVPDGEYTLVASAPNLSAAPQRVTVSGGNARADIRLQLAARSETVVVTAERTEVPVSSLGSSTTVLTRPQLEEMHAENVGAALRHVPGLTVVQTGRRGAVTSLFARGGESKYNLVMVDGVEVNEFGGPFNFAHLPIESVERIEVVRGPQSATYGVNAIGSVVHIITRRPREKFEFRGEAEGGSFSTARGSFGLGGRAGRLAWNADLMRLNTDGVVPNDDYRNEAGSLHLDFEPASATHLRYTLLANASNAGAPGAYSVAPVDRITRVNENFYVNGLEFETQRGRVRQVLTGNFFTLRRGAVTAFGPSATRQFRAGAGTETHVSLSDTDTLTFGFEYERERFLSSFVTDAGSRIFPLLRHNLGWFAENRWEHGGRIFLNAGVRLENIRTSALLADAFGSRPAVPARSDVTANPKVSVAFLPRPWGPTKIHASAGSGVRAPDGFELAFTNNAELQPERTRSFDVGIEHHFAGRRAVVDTTYFYNRYRDLIVTLRGDLRALSRWTSDNLSNARAQGLELSGAVRPAEWMSMSAQYTWLKSEVLSLEGAPGRAPLPFRVGDRLIRRPEHSASYLVTWRIPQLRLSLNTGAVMRSVTSDVDPLRGLSGPLMRNPGWIRPDLGAELALTPQVRLFGRLYNFSDSRYEEALGFPALRRHFTAGLRFRL